MFAILEHETHNQRQSDREHGLKGAILSAFGESDYESKVSGCLEHIWTGGSYELCLSDQTIINIKTSNSSCPTSWTLYLQFRETNTALFAAVPRLGALTLLSTSPERFMSWTRFEHCPPLTEGEPPDVASRRQFRPIKGTVSKERITAGGETVHSSTEEATVLLSVVKERAENLTILDLIRHDLYSVVSSWDVQFKGLMALKECETVYQLVSVIEGRLFKYFNLVLKLQIVHVLVNAPVRTVSTFLLRPHPQEASPARLSFDHVNFCRVSSNVSLDLSTPAPSAPCA